jgi:hypothetical protein
MAQTPQRHLQAITTPIGPSCRENKSSRFRSSISVVAALNYWDIPNWLANYASEKNKKDEK